MASSSWLISPTTTSPLHFPTKSRSPQPRCRLICHVFSLPTDFKFVLHDALDSSGFDTTHARAARKGFVSQIEDLTNIERETSICINRSVDLGQTALHIAAEDDSFVSQSSNHSSFPVDYFIEKLDDLSMGYCSSYSSSFSSSPDIFLHNLDTYLYVNKGFRRSNAAEEGFKPHPLYLHSVLAHRCGSVVMLSLVYSEILKMLRLWGLLDFDCEIFFPHDLHGLPRGYHKQKSVESDLPHIMTSQTLLEETLRNLKEAFWPFQYDRSKSLFLRAAHAANCIDRSKNLQDSNLQISPDKTAHYGRCNAVLTTTPFGDMRLALSACERLIILGCDPKELRDYSILLYHCGLYEQSWQYLKLYQDTKGFSLRKPSSYRFISHEEDAVEQLMVRLSLISMEKGWSKPSHV